MVCPCGVVPVSCRFTGLYAEYATSALGYDLAFEGRVPERRLAATGDGELHAIRVPREAYSSS
jgi:hypothetical protein